MDREISEILWLQWIWELLLLILLFRQLGLKKLYVVGLVEEEEKSSDRPYTDRSINRNRI